MSDRSRSSAIFVVVRALWGTTLLAAPGIVLRLLGGADEARVPKRIMRVLGARHLVQAIAEHLFGDEALRVGACVDALHALTGFGFACVDVRWRRAALADAMITSGFAAIGLSESRRGIQWCSDVIWPRRGQTGRRVLVASTIGLACGIGVSLTLPWQSSELVGWDAASLIFLVSTWIVIGPKSAPDTKEHAASEDPSAPLSDLVICSAAVACIVGAGFALGRAASSKGGTKAELIALAVVSVLVSWAAVHTVFTLRYAKLFYRGSANGTGIDFNEDDPPDYRDFAYLAMTIGMTFQVSDTDLGSKAIRRTALRHALISWLFGAVLIGLTINILASILSSGGS